jgi:hypothetical protein
MKCQSTLLSIMMTGALLLAVAATASANGEEFFAAAKGGKVDLVYFGRIKDRHTGRSIGDSVYFLLRDKATGLSFPFTNDKPGHYRSPDVGAAIKEIGETINPTAFEIDVNVAGYQRLTLRKVPRRAQGAIEVDVLLDPAVSGTVAAAGINATGPSYARTATIVLGSIVLFFIVRAVRTADRRRSTID